jgi:hypothetical protein
MPAANNPNLPEFYVYVFEADGVPFYVGIGRDARASDRLNHVRRLKRRETSGKTVRWVVSNRVFAELLTRNIKLDCKFPHRGKTRSEALILERLEIEELLSAGFVLANLQCNPKRPSTADEVVKSVISRLGRTDIRGPAIRVGLPSAGEMQSLSEETVLVANPKQKAKSGTFFALLQKAATKPIALNDLIARMIRTYTPPASTKPAAQVITIRTRYAARNGYLIPKG